MYLDLSVTMSRALKKGDDIQVQEGPNAPIRKQSLQTNQVCLKPFATNQQKTRPKNRHPLTTTARSDIKKKGRGRWLRNMGKQLMREMFVGGLLGSHVRENKGHSWFFCH